MSQISLGYGLVTCQRHPDHDEGWTPLYAEALELAAAAEEIGLDSVWVSEHHFVDDGHLPSLLVVLGAMAARTTRVTLGTALLLAPLHDPLRVVEDAAVVDQLSGGRLVLGLGLGWRDEEFEALGVPVGERVRRTRALVDIARGAWNGEAVVVRDGVAEPWVTPAPCRPGGPPLWIGALAEPAVRRAGRIADGFIACEVTPDELAVQVGWAREERARHGVEAPLEIALHLPTLVSPDGVGFAEAADHLRWADWKYGDMAEARTMSGPLGRPEPADRDYLERLESTTIVGTPRQAADRIREYADAAGGRLHMIARSYLPSLPPAARADALRALGDVRALLAD
jgi:alkanesulfonate monooxygenase SsuD/methylene tetrahydromethanopterin reductase-like flavin-dependent oxidoreductase (luciferase family)